MTTEVVSLKPTDTVRKAAIKFAVDNISGAPVVDNRNHLMGILTVNDILELLQRYQRKIDRDNPGSLILSHSMDSDNLTDDVLKSISDEISNIEVSDIMIRTVLTTSPDTPAMEVVRAMLELNVNRLPVIEKGVMIGIISRSDIIFALYERKV